MILLCSWKTVIIIAHKLSTVKNAGQILLLENGKISTGGTHDILMQSSDLYKKLFDMQYAINSWKM